MPLFEPDEPVFGLVLPGEVSVPEGAEPVLEPLVPPGLLGLLGLIEPPDSLPVDGCELEPEVPPWPEVPLEVPPLDVLVFFLCFFLCFCSGEVVVPEVSEDEPLMPPEVPVPVPLPLVPLPDVPPVEPLPIEPPEPLPIEPLP